MLTDGLLLFDVLAKATVTTEIPIYWLKNWKRVVWKMEISNVAFVLSKHNLTDPLTKVNANIILIISLRFVTLSHPLQWLSMWNRIGDENVRYGTVDNDENVEETYYVISAIMPTSSHDGIFDWFIMV